MRRSFLIGLLILGAVAVLHGDLAYAQPQCSVRVILASIGQVYNDHVGNEWSFSTSVNDGRWVAVSRYVAKTVFQRDSVVSGSSLKIIAKAVEDDKYPDIGINSKSIQVQCPSSGEGRQSLTIDVRVIEDRGHYAGNSAVWEFEFQIATEAQGTEQLPPLEEPTVKADFTLLSGARTYHVGDRVLLNASSCAGGGNILHWDFGANGTIDAIGAQVYYTISHRGMNLIALTVITPSGASASITRGVRAESPSPPRSNILPLILLLAGAAVAGVILALILTSS